jgi:hypothetical protein
MVEEAVTERAVVVAPPVRERLCPLIRPVLVIEKSVVVAVPPVVEAMVKSVVGEPKPLVEVASNESCA